MLCEKCLQMVEIVEAFSRWNTSNAAAMEDSAWSQLAIDFRAA